MTVGLWIITGIVFSILFVVLVVVVREFAKLLPLLGDHHPSDKKWRKMCESPVFPPDDSQETRTPHEEYNLEEEIHRLYGLLRPINFSLSIFHAHIRVCNHYDQLEEVTCDLISESGLEVTAYLEEYDRSIVKTDVTKNRYVMKIIRPKNEILMPTKYHTTVQFKTLCDWLSLFAADPGPLGAKALVHSLRSRNSTNDESMRQWYEKYTETYSDHIVTLTDA